MQYLVIKLLYMYKCCMLIHIYCVLLLAFIVGCWLCLNRTLMNVWSQCVYKIWLVGCFVLIINCRSCTSFCFWKFFFPIRLCTNERKAVFERIIREIRPSHEVDHIRKNLALKKVSRERICNLFLYKVTFQLHLLQNSV